MLNSADETIDPAHYQHRRNVLCDALETSDTRSGGLKARSISSSRLLLQTILRL